jgi:MTH538 TIR-like domain (DUF1863)
VAENPGDLKNFGLLAALGAEPRHNSLLDYVTTPALPVDPYPYASGLSGMFGTLAPTASANLSFNALANVVTPPPPFFAPSSPPTRPFGSLADLMAAPAPLPSNALYTPPPKPTPVAPETKRKAFFSFHFDDIMRVNNVRNAWKITHPDSSLNRSFYDSSLWEARKLVGPEGIKQLIRAGVIRTTAVCILAGSMTWDRRWVRYEIARAIIDARGLLTVHLNGINHHRTKAPDPRGRNPLAHMGIAKLQPNKRLPPQYYLYEMNLVPDGCGGTIEEWSRYVDYTQAVKKPNWLTDPPIDHVIPLSADAAEYDYNLDHGHRNIGNWIDKAAKQAGR